MEEQLRNFLLVFTNVWLLEQARFSKVVIQKPSVEDQPRACIRLGSVALGVPAYLYLVSPCLKVCRSVVMIQ